MGLMRDLNLDIGLIGPLDLGAMSSRPLSEIQPYLLVVVLYTLPSCVEISETESLMKRGVEVLLFVMMRAMLGIRTVVVMERERAMEREMKVRPSRDRVRDSCVGGGLVMVMVVCCLFLFPLLSFSPFLPAFQQQAEDFSDIASEEE